MGHSSPSKIIRSIKRMTKFAEKKKLLSSPSNQNVLTNGFSLGYSTPVLAINPKPKLTIVHLESTTLSPQPQSIPKLSIQHVQTTNVSPHPRPKPKLSIQLVQTTTVPPHPRAKPKLSIAHVQTTTVLPNPSFQIKLEEFKHNMMN